MCTLSSAYFKVSSVSAVIWLLNTIPSCSNCLRIKVLISLFGYGGVTGARLIFCHKQPENWTNYCNQFFQMPIWDVSRFVSHFLDLMCLTQASNILAISCLLSNLMFNKYLYRN